MKEIYPNQESASLRGEINNAIVFGSLSAGNYTFSISASGKDKTQELIAESFTVRDGNIYVEGEAGPGPNQALKKGGSCGLYGTVVSDNKLTYVTACVQNSGGTVIMKSTVYPNSKQCSLRGEINDSMVFNGLATGDYRYILKAADDASGEVILVDRPFRVQ